MTTICLITTPVQCTVLDGRERFNLLPAVRRGAIRCIVDQDALSPELPAAGRPAITAASTPSHASRFVKEGNGNKPQNPVD